MKNTVSSKLYFEHNSDQYGFIVRTPSGEAVRETRGNAPIMGHIAWNVERDENGAIVANDYAAVFPTPETAEAVIKSLRNEARAIGVTHYAATINKVDIEVSLTFEPF